MGEFSQNPIPSGRFWVRHKPDPDRLVDNPRHCAILPLELHCSTITNFFTIINFYKSEGVGGLDV